MLNTLTKDELMAIAESTTQLFDKALQEIMYDDRQLDLLMFSRGILLDCLLSSGAIAKESLQERDNIMHNLSQKFLTDGFKVIQAVEPTEIEDVQLIPFYKLGQFTITAYDLGKFLGYTHDYMMFTVHYLLDTLGNASREQQLDIEHIYFVPALTQDVQGNYHSTVEVTEKGVELLISELIRDETKLDVTTSNIDNLVNNLSLLKALFEAREGELDALDPDMEEIHKELLNSYDASTKERKSLAERIALDKSGLADANTAINNVYDAMINDIRIEPTPEGIAVTSMLEELVYTLFRLQERETELKYIAVNITVENTEVSLEEYKELCKEHMENYSNLLERFEEIVEFLEEQ